MENYQNALDQGKVIVLQARQTDAGNVSVQFQQRIESPQDNARSSLFAAAGTGSAFDGKTTVSPWFVLAPEVAKKHGITPGDNYKDIDMVIEAETIFGEPVTTALIENTSPNPNAKSLFPKQPGANSVEVICVNGEPVYRHILLTTQLGAGSIPGFTPHEQCTELNGRYFLTGAVTQRLPKSRFPEIYPEFASVETVEEEVKTNF